jgi:hypothetical protein
MAAQPAEHEDERARDGPRPLPWPLVAAVLSGVLLLMLGLGILANQLLRPAGTVGAQAAAAGGSAAATQTPVPQGAPALASQPGPTAPLAVPQTPASTTPASQILMTPSTAQTSQILVTAAATPASQPTPAPSLAAGSAATPTPARASAPTSAPQTPSPTPPAAAETPTPEPTVDPALAAEISAAYQHYWEVRAQALLDLDGSELPDVATGPHLQVLETRIEELRSEGKAIHTKGQHRYQVTEASAEEAFISDEYISGSFYVSTVTGEQVSEPTDDDIKEVFRMTREMGEWKVIETGQVN